jgi:hypothetical protein
VGADRSARRQRDIRTRAELAPVAGDCCSTGWSGPAAHRSGDAVARLSGDEFAVLCENITASHVLRGIAERVVHLVGAPMDIAGHTIVIGASVGAVLSTRELTDVDQLLRAADLAMYAAKRRGRGRCLVFDENPRPDVTPRVSSGVAWKTVNAARPLAVPATSSTSVSATRLMRRG